MNWGSEGSTVDVEVTQMRRWRQEVNFLGQRLLLDFIHPPVSICAIQKTRVIDTIWNNADTAIAYAPLTPSVLTEKHHPDAGAKMAIESGLRATDESKIASNCITMKEKSARYHEHGKIVCADGTLGYFCVHHEKLGFASS